MLETSKNQIIIAFFDCIPFSPFSSLMGRGGEVCGNKQEENFHPHARKVMLCSMLYMHQNTVNIQV